MFLGVNEHEIARQIEEAADLFVQDSGEQVASSTMTVPRLFQLAQEIGQNIKIQ